MDATDYALMFSVFNAHKLKEWLVMVNSSVKLIRRVAQVKCGAQQHPNSNCNERWNHYRAGHDNSQKKHHASYWAQRMLL